MEQLQNFFIIFEFTRLGETTVMKRSDVFECVAEHDPQLTFDSIETRIQDTLADEFSLSGFDNFVITHYQKLS